MFEVTAKKDKQMNFRFTEEEWEWLHKRAAADGLTLTELLRNALNAYRLSENVQ